MLTDVREDGLAGPARSRFSRARVPSWALDVLICCLLAGGAIALHLSIAGPVPSGADGGNWLAIAREQLGTNAMAGDAEYAPLFPMFLARLLLIFEPVTALVIAGLVSKVALLLSVYWCGRSVGRSYGLAAALLVGVTGAHLEAYAWGAYPQTLASAFGLLSVYLFVEYLRERRRRQLLIGLLATVATLTTHLLIGGLLLFAVPIALASWMWATKADRATWFRAAWVTLLVSVPAGIYLYQTVIVAGENGYRPPVNPLGLGLWFSIVHTTREAPLLWVLLTILAVVGLVGRNRAPAVLPTKATAFSWGLMGLVFFLVTGEARSLLMTQIGLILLGMIGFRNLWHATRQRALGEERPRFAGAVWKGLAVLGVGVFFGLVVGGIGSYRDTTGWFRIVGQPELEALDALKEAANEGDLVVASAGMNGHPLGWWVQGYAGIPTFTGIDLRWLAFPLEREQAELANAVFSGDLNVAETSALLDSVGADFLVVDRRDPNGDWISTPSAQAFPVLYQSNTLVVMGAIPVGTTHD